VYFGESEALPLLRLEASNAMGRLVYCERHNLWRSFGEGCKLCEIEGPPKPQGLEPYLPSPVYWAILRKPR